MARGAFYRPDEIEALRVAFLNLDIPDPIAAHIQNYPHRKPSNIALLAGKFGFARTRRGLERAAVIAYRDEQKRRKMLDDARAVLAGIALPPHPRGYVRPILCPHCRGIVVVPADPLVGDVA